MSVQWKIKFLKTDLEYRGREWERKCGSKKQRQTEMAEKLSVERKLKGQHVSKIDQQLKTIGDQK